MKEERGSVILFSAIVVLPMMFLLMMLCIDLSRYYVESEHVQQLLDDAAMHAYRFLPVESEAEDAARSYIRNLGYLPGMIEARARGGTIDISYHGVTRLSFAGLVGDRLGLPIEARARARGATLHAVVALDTSEYLAPGSDTSLWGDSTEWPALQRFTLESPFLSNHSARFFSQRCFNPYFNALKRVVHGLFIYMASAEQNSVGVLAFPGTLGSVDVLRSAANGGQLSDRIPEAYFLSANGSAASNLRCAAAFEDEPGVHRYLEPELPGAALRAGPKEFSERVTFPGTYFLRTEGLRNYSTASLLWHRAVRESTADVGALLASVIAEWLRAGIVSPDSSDVFSAHAVNVAVVVSADLPRIGRLRFPDASVQAVLRTRLRELASAAEERSQGAAKLLWILLPSPAQPVTGVEAARLQAFFDAEAISQATQRPVESRVVYVGDEIRTLRSVQMILAGVLTPSVIER